MRAHALSPRRAAVVATSVVAVVACGLLALRVFNDALDPVDQNWWLVADLGVGLAYLTGGLAIVGLPSRRLLGASFIAVAVAALVQVLATQYAGYAAAQEDVVSWAFLASLEPWAWLVGSAVLAGPLLFALLPAPWRHHGLIRAAVAASLTCVAVLIACHLTLPWPAKLGANPLAVTGGLRRALDVGADAATVGVQLLATGAVVAFAVRWRRRVPDSDDPLPGWLLTGAAVAWLAVVPTTWDALAERLPAPAVVPPLLLLATVPLLVIGAALSVMRSDPSAFEGVSPRLLEWTLLVAGIGVVYTGVVAGLGSLVGGSGPTWFLVAATGAIAVGMEPARQRVRALADRLVYGSRDNALSLVRQVMAHVSAASTGDDLLAALADSLGREMRLDAVAIDVARAGGWEPAATYRSEPSTGRDTSALHSRQIPLEYHGDVVGRLVVAWADAPSLRPRDTTTLEELAAPLALAVSWVRLAADLRRSSLAVVSAREEERRRIRRDLHDGLGPALTGISLGLRAAIVQIRRGSPDGQASIPTLGLLGRVADEVDITVVEVKRLVRDLRPSVLDQLGLVAALTEFTRTYGDAVVFDLQLPDREPALPAAVEVAVYRIVTEALTNVVRHAAATRCSLTMAAAETVDIDVVDDGVGFDPSTSVAGVGLLAMRERASELGGTVSVSPNLPHGTRLHVCLPAALP